MFVHYFLFGAAVHRLCRGGAWQGGAAWCCRLLIGCLGGGQVLADLLPLSLLDVIPGGVLQVGLHLTDTQEESRVSED